MATERPYDGPAIVRAYAREPDWMNFTPGYVDAMSEDGSGNVWIAHRSAGLLRVSPDREVVALPWAKLGHKDSASRVIADADRGGVWLGFLLEGVSYVVGSDVKERYTSASGLAAGRVSDLRLDREGAVWVAAAGGLSRIRNGRVATLSARSGLPCDSVDWSIEDDADSTWLRTTCGILGIPKAELADWAAAVDRGTDARPLFHGTLLDNADGARSSAALSSFSPLVTKAWDGKLWFVAVNGLAALDPRRLRRNPLPPPVAIEEVIADRVSYPREGSPIRLPPLVRDLQINYTALSFVAPEKNRFRYRLEGRDRDWQDAGTRRQAFYTDLRPGDYRFRMTASNNSGVWNEAGTSLDFSIAPAYYQTAWFRLAGVAALAGLLAALYRLRLRQVTRQVRMRMEVRLDERERIARDLHDTLLQSVQGLILKFDAVGKRIPRGDPARQAIEETLDRADEILVEGRDRVRSLRGSAAALGDLPAAFQRIAKEAAQGGATTFQSVVEGRARDLDPTVLEESFSIGREALLNALAHSGALHVELEIAYDARQFRLRIRDDGRGIDPEVLDRGGRSDHWGLQGMRERARRIGANLELWSRPGAGTEVELKVPAATAYRSARAAATTSWFRRSAGR